MPEVSQDSAPSKVVLFPLSGPNLCLHCRKCDLIWLLRGVEWDHDVELDPMPECPVCLRGDDLSRAIVLAKRQGKKLVEVGESGRRIPRCQCGHPMGSPPCKAYHENLDVGGM